MLRCYLKETSLYLPYSGNRYTVNQDGLITDLVSDTNVIPNENNEIFIQLFGSTRWVNLDWAVAAAYKPMFKAEGFILNFTVIRSSKPGLNYLESLLWVPPTGGQEDPERSGYYIVPFYTKYSVSDTGDIINRSTGNRISVRKYTNGYYNAAAWCDGRPGKVSVLGIHRAIGLARIPYGNNVLDLQINHKDKDKSYNWLINLEWATASENNFHARVGELRESSRPIIVKDLLMGSEKEYSSTSKAAKAHAMPPRTLSSILFRTPDRVIDGRWWFRYSDSGLTKPELTEDEIVLLKQQEEEKRLNSICIGRNVFTGMTYIADNAFALARVIGLPKDDVITALKDNMLYPYKGWQCWFKFKPKQFINTPLEVLEKYKDCSMISPVMVKDLTTGEEKYYQSRAKAANDLGYTKTTFLSKVQNKDIVVLDQYEIHTDKSPTFQGPIVSNGD